MNNGPIGVFDSGLGGISVLRSIIGYMPDEKYIYYGDSANAPYGVRSDEEVYAFTEGVCEKLIGQGAKAVVFACNTATSVAIRKLRLKYPDVPLIGMEPALKPAAEACRGGRIVVMATPVTLRRPKFEALMKRYSEESEIIPMPAPEIVSFVENGILEGDELKTYVKRCFSSCVNGRADAVVLGCTHFPFVENVIREAAGPQARMFNGNMGTARELRRRMAEKDLLAGGASGPEISELMNGIAGETGIKVDVGGTEAVIYNSAGISQTELSVRLLMGE